MNRRTFLLVPVAFCVLAVCAWAAAITSTANGLWDAGGTWVGGVVPGNGDTAVIAHNVTIADGDTRTIGTSGASGTTAITINDGKKLTVGQGTSGQLICRGDIVSAQTSTTRVSGFAALEFKPGADFQWDASQATTPLSQTYVFRPSAGNQPNSRVYFSGTSVAHVTVSSNSGGGKGRFSNGGFFTRVGSYVGTYVDFNRIGDASNSSFDMYLSNTAVEPDIFSLHNYTMNNCGAIGGGSSLGSGTIVSLVDGKHTNSPGTSCWIQSTSTNAITTGTREMTRVSFDKLLGAGSTNFKDFTFTDVVADGGPGFFWTSGTLPASWTRGMIRRTSGAEMVWGGTVTDPLLLSEYNSAGWFSDISDTPLTVTGALWQSESATGGGAFMLFSKAHTVSTAFTFTGNMCLTCQGGSAPFDSPGCIAILSTTSVNPLITINHNTWSSGIFPPVMYSYVIKSAAGVIASLKSNAIYTVKSPQASLQYILYDNASGGATTDVVTGANADYNGSFGVKAGTPGKGYNGTFTVAPGAHDQYSVNPNYIASGRNMAAWSASVGGAATTAGARSLITADPTKADVCRRWIRDGFAPTNVLYDNTAHDGGDIGAMNYQLAAPLVAGSISLTSKTSSDIQLSATTATGGTSPYTYQWYRDSSPSFTPGPSNIMPGEVALTLVDVGLAANTSYSYALIYTDSVGVTATATTLTVTTDASSGGTTRNIQRNRMPVTVVRRPSKDLLGRGRVAGATTATATIDATTDSYTQITATGTAATGGVAPYTYQVQYTTNKTGTWANIGSPQTKGQGIAPDPVVIPGLIPGTTYWFRYSLTDSVSTYNTPIDAATPTVSDIPTVVATWKGLLTSLLQQSLVNPRLVAIDGSTFNVNTDLNHDGILSGIEGLRALPGNADLTTYLTEQRRLYRDIYLIPNNGGLPGYYAMAEGLALDWERNGDTTSRDALKWLRQGPTGSGGAAYVNSGNTGPSTTEAFTREISYALWTQVENHRLGLVTWNSTRVSDLVTALLAHHDEWNVDPTNWTATTIAGGYIQPWMMGINMQSLIHYLEYIESPAGGSTTDARIVPAMARTLHRIRQLWWETSDGGEAYYIVNLDGTYALGDVLACFDASAAAWMYKRTGDTYFKSMADTAFASCLNSANFYYAKQYNELNSRDAHKYMEWRHATPGSDNQYIVCSPPFFQKGANTVASGNYFVKPLANFTGTVTMSSGGGGGTFTPSTLSWTADKSVKTFTYTPASTGNKTISMTNNGGFANPANSNYLSQ